MLCCDSPCGTMQTKKVFYMRLSVDDPAQDGDSYHIALEVLGVDTPLPRFMQGLRRMLSNTLASMTLVNLSTLLARNPRFKLTPGDLAFIKPPQQAPNRLAGWLLPSLVMDDQLYMLLLKQSVRMYLSTLHRTAPEGGDGTSGDGGGAGPGAGAGGGAAAAGGAGSTPHAAAGSDAGVVPSSSFTTALQLQFVFNNSPTKDPVAAAVVKQVGTGMAVVYVSIVDADALVEDMRAEEGATAAAGSAAMSALTPPRAGARARRLAQRRLAQQSGSGSVWRAERIPRRRLVPAVEAQGWSSSAMSTPTLVKGPGLAGLGDPAEAAAAAAVATSAATPSSSGGVAGAASGEGYASGSGYEADADTHRRRSTKSGEAAIAKVDTEAAGAQPGAAGETASAHAVPKVPRARPPRQHARPHHHHRHHHHHHRHHRTRSEWSFRPKRFMVCVEVWAKSAGRMHVDALTRRIGLSVRQTLMEYALEVKFLAPRGWLVPSKAPPPAPASSPPSPTDVTSPHSVDRASPNSTGSSRDKAVVSPTPQPETRPTTERIVVRRQAVRGALRALVAAYRIKTPSVHQMRLEQNVPHSAQRR